MRPLPKRFSLNPIQRFLLSRLASAVRHVYSFDGIDDRGQLAFRAINPDGDIDIEFTTGEIVPVAPATTLAVISQNIAGTATSWEFAVRVANPSGNIQLIIGGVFAGSSNTPIAPNTRYRITLVGTALNYYINGNVAASYVYNRGTAREPSAVTVIGARTNGSVGTATGYYRGELYNVKINGVLWPLADRDQPIQLPRPASLGAELITESVHLTPAAKGSQWTYLGSGRWQYVGDGSLNELTFIDVNAQPTAGFLEFEIESISGQLTCTFGAAASIQPSVFNTAGVKRYFYTSPGGSNNNRINFKRNFSGVGIVTSCIIKNISFKPLASCNPLVLSNINADRWQEVEGTLPAVRRVYDFDGVDDRGMLLARAINPDGDILIAWEQQFFTGTNTANGVIVSQCGTGVNSTQEFRLTFLSATNTLELIVGGAANLLMVGAPRSGKYMVTLIGNAIKLYLNGEVVKDGVFNRGPAREPAAETIIGMRLPANNYFPGALYDVKIGNTFWPIAEAGVTVQLPEPSGLGTLVNSATGFVVPNAFDNTITYKDSNRFETVKGTTASRVAIAFSSASVTSYLVEFNVSYIETGRTLGVFVRDGSAAGTGTIIYTLASVVLGVNRMVFNRLSANANVLFVANNAGDFKVDSFSIRQLGTCNPLELRNINPDRWAEVIK